MKMSIPLYLRINRMLAEDDEVTVGIYSDWKSGVTISQLAERNDLDIDDVHEIIDLEIEREDALLLEMGHENYSITTK